MVNITFPGKLIFCVTFLIELKMENTTLFNADNIWTHFESDLFVNKETAETKDEFLLMLLDRSQLVMTIIGIIANIGTSITLMKNKQVCKTTSLSINCAENHRHRNTGVFSAQNSLSIGLFP